MSEDDRFEPGPAVAASIAVLAATCAVAVAVALSASAPVRTLALEARAGVANATEAVRSAARARMRTAWLSDSVREEIRLQQAAFAAMDRRARMLRGEAAEALDTAFAQFDPISVTEPLKTGDYLAAYMQRHGVEPREAAAAAAALRGVYDARDLRAGQPVSLTLSRPPLTVAQIAAGDDGGALALEQVVFRPDVAKEIRITRIGGGFDAERTDIALTRRTVSMSGAIDGSLYQSAADAGLHPTAIYQLANVFAYDVDFQRDIRPGDDFEAVYEQILNDRGQVVGVSDLLFARLNWRGRRKEKGYYLFNPPDGLEDYFDASGESAKRLLMKTPIDGARVSSGFGVRRHPISGYTRKHKGVDFAARPGTPIKAAGDGVILRADRFGSFGNYVKIRHANGYETAYAHLKGFSRSARKGRRVRQGDIIGYVGSTGASTGPHLHYEVHRHGSQVNPMNLDVATGRSLSGAEKEAFRARREEIDAMRTSAPTPLAKADPVEPDATY
ncbi:MAG: peptidoglycan DD-metalloendopeptidase family protein [Pseudomonadota bacterium]